MKKMLMMAVAVILIVVISVSATFAYLTDKQEVTNTFAVGKVDITLAETVKEAEATQDENGNATFKAIVPGHTYTKAPVVTVKADSEKCYVFVKVENGLATIEQAQNNIDSQIQANEWTPLADNAGVYYKVVDKAGTDTVLPVFATVTVDGATDNATLAGYANKTIEVTAYAVQHDMMDNAAAAWTVAQGATAYNP